MVIDYPYYGNRLHLLQRHKNLLFIEANPTKTRLNHSGTYNNISRPKTNQNNCQQTYPISISIDHDPIRIRHHFISENTKVTNITKINRTNTNDSRPNITRPTTQSISISIRENIVFYRFYQFQPKS